MSWRNVNQEIRLEEIGREPIPSKLGHNSLFHCSGQCCIRIVYNADPDPGSQAHADSFGFDSVSWSDFAVTKTWIFTWKYTLCRYLHKYKSLIERLEIRFILFVNFGQFPCFWIRIRIHNRANMGPDPGKPNQCGSGSTALFTSPFKKVCFENILLSQAISGGGPE